MGIRPCLAAGYHAFGLSWRAIHGLPRWWTMMLMFGLPTSTGRKIQQSQKPAPAAPGQAFSTPHFVFSSPKSSSIPPVKSGSAGE